MIDVEVHEALDKLEQEIILLKARCDTTTHELMIFDELLEAAKALMRIVPRYTDEPYALLLRHLEEAIAKAEGRAS